MYKKWLKRIGIIAVALVLLVYIGYQIFNSTYSQIHTETASYAEVDETVSATGFVVREETILSNDTDGVLTYLMEDGDKVSKDGKVAEIYANASDVSTQKSIQSLQEEKDRLQQLSRASEAFTSPDSLDRQILQSLKSMQTAIHEGEYSSLDKQREDLLYQLNEWQIVTQKVDNFDGRIQNLQQQLDGLLEQHSDSVGSVTSPLAGYFGRTLDGYESTFSYDDILSLTPEQVEEGLAAEPSEIPQNAVGKVVSSLSWYMVCNVSTEDALKLQIGKKGVTLQMPFASMESVPVSVEAVNQTDADDTAAVVLRCDYMSSDLANIRKEPIQIHTDPYQGIRVSKKAVHMDTVSRTKTDEEGNKVLDENGNPVMEEKEVQGVYVLFGGELVFKEIVPLYTSETYVICDPSPDEGVLFSGSTIQLYDEVVIEGTDLKDGKMVR